MNNQLLVKLLRHFTQTQIPNDANVKRNASVLRLWFCCLSWNIKFVDTKILLAEGASLPGQNLPKLQLVLLPRRYFQTPGAIEPTYDEFQIIEKRKKISYTQGSLKKNKNQKVKIF